MTKGRPYGCFFGGVFGVLRCGYDIRHGSSPPQTPRSDQAPPPRGRTRDPREHASHKLDGCIIHGFCVPFIFTLQLVIPGSAYDQGTGTRPVTVYYSPDKLTFPSTPSLSPGEKARQCKTKLSETKQKGRGRVLEYIYDKGEEC